MNSGCPESAPHFHHDPSLFTWHNFFLGVDKLLKWWERSGSKAVRRRAVEKARNWMVERLHHSDGLGAIYPPMMYSVMALDVLGFAKDDPLRVEALRHFNNLMVDDGDRFFFQPCFSPVWDTRSGLTPWRWPIPITSRSPRRRTGCSTRKSGARAIGASNVPIPSLPAGPSNTPTNFIRISTTPRW